MAAKDRRLHRVDISKEFSQFRETITGDLKVNYQDVIRNMVQKCADAGIKLAQERSACGVFLPMYLYYREATSSSNGELVLLDDYMTVPPGFKRASTDALHSGVPFLNYFCWVKERSTRLPVLCPGEIALAT